MGTLSGKTAVVTGSTSGIGLAYARAFAGAGANIVINGMGAPADIEKERTAIETDFKVKCIHSPADMTRPAEIVEMKDRHGDFAGSTLIIGEAVYIRIASYLLNEGNYDALAAQPVLRGGGPSDYFEVKRSGHFAMQRPQIQP